jgi:CO/xanthine dehydrogenase FAD-binding subunit
MYYKFVALSQHPEEPRGDTHLMTIWSKYYIAHSIEEALGVLASSPQPSLPIGGGTDLLLEIQQGLTPPVHTLVDLTQIPELNVIEERDHQLFVGAAVSINKIVASPLVHYHAQAVTEACDLIGGPQVRNTATLGGNVAHALPAADGMISLVAMDAVAEIAGLGGYRHTPILDLFSGPGVSTLETGKEILCGFYLPLRREHQASAFNRVMRPQGVALPIINMAVWLERDGDLIRDIRIAIGPSGPTPRRASAVEEYLKGKPLSEDHNNTARKLLNETMRFRTSPRRATAGYRYHLAGYLLVDLIQKAWKRAEGVSR